DSRVKLIILPCSRSIEYNCTTRRRLQGMNVQCVVQKRHVTPECIHPSVVARHCSRKRQRFRCPTMKCCEQILNRPARLGFDTLYQIVRVYSERVRIVLSESSDCKKLEK